MANATHLKIGDTQAIPKNYQEQLKDDNGTFVLMQQTGTGLPQVRILTVQEGSIASYQIPQSRMPAVKNEDWFVCKVSETAIPLPAGTRSRTASQS